ncbi:PAS domain-containing protein [Sphingomonas sp. AR_OL41]|uniref:PAS domain-containing protein n=1 Tax=Sphingomonas sp. AR_OL41 TaxID=3042729 RepID=UPI0024803A69|nr:PAS domain-containing protein [Sphingomonas sp. AR_OL41]MDH7974349.1 PAS domain-containing protein [Sphingomonas sp. AR_OL41]
MSLSSMIQSSAVAAVISNPRLADNPIIDCNEAFVQLTGYERDEIIGRNCRFLRGADTEDALSQELREGIAAHRPTMVEILNYKKDGTRFRNAVLVAPIFGATGELEYFLGSQVEVAGDEAAAGDNRRKAAAERIASLTPRQREIVVHIAAGKLNKQIAYELGLNERTVKMHRSTVIRVLGLRTTADIIRLAIEAGY